MTLAALIAAGAAITTMGLGLGGIIYRLGGIHADLRRMVTIIEDHEDRLRSLERGQHGKQIAA